MLGITLVCVLATCSAPEVADGAVLPAGVHAAAILIDAQQIYDELPAELAAPEVASAPVELVAPLTVREESVLSLRIALRVAGVTRIPFRYRDGGEVAYFTDRAHGPPHAPLPYRVYLVKVHHLDVEIAQDVLMRGVEREEQDVGDLFRTRVVADARTSRVLIRARTEGRYRELLARLERIDVPPEKDSPIELHTWIPRGIPAQVLIQRFRELWKDPEGSTLVVREAKSTQALLFASSPEEWTRAESILERLDPGTP